MMERRCSQTFSPFDLLFDAVYEGAQNLSTKWQVERQVHPQPFKSPQVVLIGRKAVDLITNRDLIDEMSLG